MNAIDLTAVFARIANRTYFFDSNSDEIALTSVDQRDWKADTPLHVAVQCGDSDAVSVLLAHGADIDAGGEAGLTPLHNAALKNNHELVLLLLNNGADVTRKDDEGRTAAEIARLLGFAELASTIRAGVSRRKRDEI